MAFRLETIFLFYLTVKTKDAAYRFSFKKMLVLFPLANHGRRMTPVILIDTVKRTQAVEPALQGNVSYT